MPIFPRFPSRSRLAAAIFLKLKPRQGVITLVMLVGGALTGCQSTPLDDACYVKPESGQCRAAITRFYFDDRRGECRAFIWGGCQGVVPFETLPSCENTCGTLDSTFNIESLDAPPADTHPDNKDAQQ
ncbi:MAG: BPTI/Kunitz-type proteinase inhibitor domain-containing protein [Alcanivoracaceae bacterium]|nr:BPTI/Kunitz-type proteinase inhibitor domain-containing protein [Alcanivoracaceae bacterium]